MIKIIISPFKVEQHPESNNLLVVNQHIPLVLPVSPVACMLHQVRKSRVHRSGEGSGYANKLVAPNLRCAECFVTVTLMFWRKLISFIVIRI